jgi:hypothetical protein
MFNSLDNIFLSVYLWNAQNEMLLEVPTCYGLMMRIKLCDNILCI